MALEIHFLNVGHGDCTIIKFPSGRIMMIDINNSNTLPEDDVVALAESKGMSTWAFRNQVTLEAKRSWEDYYKSLLVDPAEYFNVHFPGESVFRYVQTHPDLDHMSGLHRFFWQDRIRLVNFWDVAHAKELDEENFKNCPYDYADWVAYLALREGWGPNSDGSLDKEHHKVLNLLRGSSADFWAGDGVEILSPTAELIEACNASDKYNNVSYVLKLTYGGRSVILPGDAEASAWKSILDEPGAGQIACDVLKASHHGRESGYHEEAVDAMSPEVVICSVGKKPSTDASDEYASHGAAVLSTRFHGTIKMTVWGDGDIWIDNHKGDRIYTIT
ncbi:ComEC/Rec2 family competence protein [Nucisporomicrobium flavum]|uniref:ComEC/Rec2 family competence protein n=1 Tax=Nucisporomicrobium flavum TaxID=2785915 RepID=UPI003C2B17C8